MPYTYQENLAAQAHAILSKVKISQLETIRLLLKIEEIEEKLINTKSVVIINEKRKYNIDGLSQNRILLADFRDVLVKKIDESEKQIFILEEIVDKLDAPLERLVLRKYYLDGESTYQIASDLNYSHRHILRIKKSGLQNVATRISGRNN